MMAMAIWIDALPSAPIRGRRRPALTRAGLQTVWFKPALFLARGIRSGGLAMGPPVGGELDPHQIAVTLSISCAEEAIPQPGIVSPARLARRRSVMVDRADRRVLVHTEFNEGHCILHTR